MAYNKSITRRKNPMIKMEERYRKMKHRVEHTNEYLQKKVEEMHQEYLSTSTPTRKYRVWCRKNGLTVPDWAQEAAKRYKVEVDVTSDGKPRRNVRATSKKYLKRFGIEKQKGYVIHHCCGYENPDKFVYLPVELHNKIHKFLRANNVIADSNHYDMIKNMLSESDKQTFVHL